MQTTSPDAASEEAAAGQGADELPPMERPLDEVISFPEEVCDLKLVERDFEGQGSFTALHHVEMSRSLMCGSFHSRSSTGGVTTYEGTFLCDPHNERPIPSGQGVRTNVDGSMYSGQWKEGFPDGTGEFKAAPPNQASYVGEWKRGKKHGYGVQKFANGDKYEGDWANGLFQDRGKYIFASGDEFLGIFLNGMKKEGTFYFRDGRLSTRRWDRGCLVSCQDYNLKRQNYQPTITKEEVHDPERNAFGANVESSIMISPRGIRVD